MCPDLGKARAKWNDIRVLIFTEYDDTKRYLVDRLEAAIAGSDQAERRIRIFHGPHCPKTVTKSRKRSTQPHTNIRSAS